nr:alpha/beta fold hydrolase [uncultured Corynebacterium sp.]
MAPDPIVELRNSISAQLGKFWRPSEDSPRYGIATPATAIALREDVSQEIASRLHARPDSTPGEKILEADTAATLPLGARIKPRGIFEDDWSARPTPERPWPVILIHGTCDTKGIWQLLGTQLREDGWAVFAPDYGNRATQPIPESSQQLGSYIDAVLNVTGAEKAILVGHSQGGLVSPLLDAHRWRRRKGPPSHLPKLPQPRHDAGRNRQPACAQRTPRSGDALHH